MTWIKMEHYSVWSSQDEKSCPQLAFVSGCGPERAQAWLNLELGAALLALTDGPDSGELLAFHRDPNGRVRNLTGFLRDRDGGSPFYRDSDEGQKRLRDWVAVIDVLLGVSNSSSK